MSLRQQIAEFLKDRDDAFVMTDEQTDAERDYSAGIIMELIAASNPPLTAAQLADAFDCAWNAAIGEAHRQQGGHETAAIIAESFAAISSRLREIAQPSEKEKT